MSSPVVISSALCSPFQCPDMVKHWSAAAAAALTLLPPLKTSVLTLCSLGMVSGENGTSGSHFGLYWVLRCVGCPRLPVLELFHTGVFADGHFCCSWHKIWSVYGWDIRILLGIVKTSPSSVENCRSLPAEYGEELPAWRDFKLFSCCFSPPSNLNALSHFQTPRYQFSG